MENNINTYLIIMVTFSPLKILPIIPLFEILI